MPGRWQRWQNHWAHFLLARIVSFVALRQFRTMRARDFLEWLNGLLRFGKRGA
jgi:hypothetical protein